MSESEKSTDNILVYPEERDEIQEQVDILALMRNMIEEEEGNRQDLDIFDENNHSIFPTHWTKQSQLATCRKCGRTGESIIERRCGIGNYCCSCCFCLVCLWICVPCMCCAVCDHYHYCSSCRDIMGVKTFI